MRNNWWLLITLYLQAANKLEDWTDKITGNKSDAKATFFMGVTSLCYSFLIMLLYFILNRYTGVRALHIAFWVSQSHDVTSVSHDSNDSQERHDGHDSLMLRKVFRITTAMSLLATFAGNWIALVFFLVYADGNDLWGTAGVWIGMISSPCSLVRGLQV